jgi:hypothetical protein
VTSASSTEVPEHLTENEWRLLRQIAVSGEAVDPDLPERRPGKTIRLVVNACAYSCCGRGWQRRDGYEQTYHGYVDNLTDRTLMLYSVGIGTVSYVLAVRFFEIEELVLLNGSA